jgi:two-component system, OmpR family, sensor histidine kinase KdpD
VSRIELQRPDPAEVLRRLAIEGRPKALFRTYLGYARGCGASTAMLDEGRRRAARGTDVIVAAFSVHDDPAAALGGLEVLGGLVGKRPGRALDVEKLLARNPQVACIDDLAASDSEGRPVFENVPRLLAAGITVLATLHLLSIESAATTFAGLAGPPAASQPLVDDSFLATIHELELVDLPPDDLLDRLRSRPVLVPAALAVAMQRELRPDVLDALRELAFRVIADHTDRDLLSYLAENKIPTRWEVRGRIVLCLPPKPGLEERITAAGRYAAAMDAMFTAVTVRTAALGPEEKEMMGGYAALTHKLGGEFVHLHGRSVSATLRDYIRSSLATEVILGHRNSRWTPWDTTSDLIRGLAGVDVHILRTSAEPPGSSFGSQLNSDSSTRSR